MSDIVKFHIHYDVDEHFIPMSDFLIAANSAQKIIDDLNKQVFGNQFRYRLMVLPPEEGTFLKTVGIYAIAGAAYISHPIVSDYTLGAFKGLTNKTPYEYGENHLIALKDSVVGFFSKEVEELEKIIPRELNLDKSFKAKTDFYKSCGSIESLRAVGFDSTKNFSIKKASFKNHLSKDRFRELNSDFVIYDVIVTSPVTEDKDYVWDFEDVVTGSKISAYMRDGLFKEGVLNGKYPFKNDGANSDKLRILVEYKKQERNGEIEKKETCVETVYSFNNLSITPIPENLPLGTKFQIQSELPMDKIWELK